MSWIHKETFYHPNDEALAASRFFIGNGLLGIRGSLDELGTKGVQGLYAAGFFRKRFVTQFETADTYTRKRRIFDEEIMSRGNEIYEIQGLPDILFCRLEVDGEVFRMWEGDCSDFERELDLRQGLLRRSLRWTSPNGVVLQLCFERFCSWSDPRLIWQRISVKNASAATVVIGPGIDPTLETLLQCEDWCRGEGHLSCSVLAAGSGIRTRLRQAWQFQLNEKPVSASAEPSDLVARPYQRSCFKLQAGDNLVLERVTAIAPENQPLWAATDAELEPIVAAAISQGWSAGLDSSNAVLADKWRAADIEIAGPAQDQLGLRFALYQLLAAAPWDYDHISIGAKCLSGQGYNGHVFWDNDINILPFYQWVFPKAAGNHCSYRYRMLEDARKLARKEGRPGARYPWQSALEGYDHAPEFIRCSRTQIHVVGDVAYAANRLHAIAGDDAIAPSKVAEMTVECARYLRSRLSWNSGQQRFELHGVGGPDEYHPVTNNNAYTNYLVAHVLQRACDWAARYPDLATVEEIDDWQNAAHKLFLPMDPATGLIPQCDGFFDLAETWEVVGGDWGGIGAEFEKCKALKQPDVLLLLTLFPERFDERAWRTNWDYYERFILHGSSLSPSIHALVGARAGLPQRARHYFDLAAQFEFRNHNKDTHHGIHIGNSGGLWQAVVFGFAGFQVTADGRLQLDPCLPVEWSRLSFRLIYRGQQYAIRLCADSVEVSLDAHSTAAEASHWCVFGQEQAISSGQTLSFLKNQ
jgi:trehalose/maltose hydrolase-like predicted phosphorylase